MPSWLKITFKIASFILGIVLILIGALSFFGAIWCSPGSEFCTQDNQVVISIWSVPLFFLPGSILIALTFVRKIWKLILTILVLTVLISLGWLLLLKLAFPPA